MKKLTEAYQQLLAYAPEAAGGTIERYRTELAENDAHVFQIRMSSDFSDYTVAKLEAGKVTCYMRTTLAEIADEFYSGLSNCS